MRALRKTSILAILFATVLGAQAGTQTFNSTGAAQSFVVPAGVTALTVAANGAQGGAGSFSGGGGHTGGITTATISVTPGEMLSVFVGGAGGSGNGVSSGTGGFNGGGTGGSFSSGGGGGGGGGGASDVRQGGSAPVNRVVVAGGAGGNGGSSGGGSGGGAGDSGNGGNGGIGPGGSGGDGGSGGAGPGATGADGSSAGLGGGGAGGGGYLGGGGGTAGTFDPDGSGSPGGGGGGSSYAIPSATNVSMTSGTRSGGGQVVLTWQVTALAVTNDAELRAALTAIDAGGTITFANDITLAGDLPAVQKSIIIDGAGHTLDGASTYRGLFFAAWTPGTATFVPVTATVENLTLTHCQARGGALSGNGGGGGGAGLGGAIFVADQANVSLRGVSLAGNAAVGGNRGDNIGGGGGGGMGGNGARNSSGGGGGLGIGGNANYVGSGGAGPIALGAASAGSGAGAIGSISGGPNGGGGGFGGLNSDGTSLAGAGGGGVGGGTGIGLNGGSGGFGGGGGAAGGNGVISGSANGGAGGFGGGGGGAGDAGPGGSSRGGDGGFGGGAASGGIDGFGAGGGSGAGLGGAIFVMQGGTLTISGSLTINGNSATGGTGGSAFGTGIFVQGNNTLTFSPAAGSAEILGADTVADQSGNGGTGLNAGAGSLTKSGDGILVVGGANTYTGVTTLGAGILALVNANGSATGTSAVNVQTGASLTGRGSAAGQVNLLGGTLYPDSDQRLALGALVWNGGSTVAASLDASATVPVQIAGALTKGTAGTYAIALTDGGVTPGTTYTLLTFASNAGFTASDFTVTGLGGTLTLEANALKFTTTLTPPTYGVAVSVAKGHNRATFTVTNTGSTTTGFAIRQANVVTNTYAGPPPPAPGSSPIRITYSLNGQDITAQIAAQTASVNLASGATAKVVVKIAVRSGRKILAKRIVQAAITASSQVDPAQTGSASARFVLKPATD